MEQDIQRSLGKRVWLKSGGYLIIETTEALTSIDINTGRFVGKKTLEETILKTNLEAAEEIVIQLRLRNIGGIIIIDFIDMERESSKEQVYRFLESKLRDDKSKTTLLKISNLGLVEMTRKRTRESLQRYLTEACPNCDGQGFIKSRVAIAHQVLRNIRRELPQFTEDHLNVAVHPDIYRILMEYEKQNLVILEKQYQKGIRLKAEPTFHIEQIALKTETDINLRPSTLPRILPAKPQPLESSKDQEEVEDEAAYEADCRDIAQFQSEQNQSKKVPLPKPEDSISLEEASSKEIEAAEAQDEALETPVIRTEKEDIAVTDISSEEEEENR